MPMRRPRLALAHDWNHRFRLTIFTAFAMLMMAVNFLARVIDVKGAFLKGKFNSATTNVQDMLFVRQIIESMGLKVKLPMVLRVDNQGVRELIKNWSVGGRTRHVATKAMFLRELKEWGLVAKCAQTYLQKTCQDHCLPSTHSIT
jgi:hypothetical protein